MLDQFQKGSTCLSFRYNKDNIVLFSSEFNSHQGILGRALWNVLPKLWVDWNGERL
jgi:hypothetical protein